MADKRYKTMPPYPRIPRNRKRGTEMQEWLVSLKTREHLGELRRMVTVKWASGFAQVVTILATEEQAKMLRQIPWIEGVVEPKVYNLI